MAGVTLVARAIISDLATGAVTVLGEVPLAKSKDYNGRLLAGLVKILANSQQLQLLNHLLSGWLIWLS